MIEADPVVSQNIDPKRPSRLERARAVRAAKKASGICIKCDRPASPNRVRCEFCLSRHRAYDAKATCNLEPAVSFDVIGAAIGCSQAQTRWIYKGAMRKLRRACERLGIEAHDVPRLLNQMQRCEDYA